MDHPYTSQMPQLRLVREGLTLAADAATLCKMTVDDRVLMLKRREAESHNEDVRNACARHAVRFGFVISDLSALCAKVGLKDIPVLDDATWMSYVSGTSTSVGHALPNALDEVHRLLSKRRDELQVIEDDDGASSYSDYSDSDTETTESASGEEEDEDSDGGSD